MQLAVRTEYSRELVDAPQSRYGISATWRMTEHILLVTDYLHAKFNTNPDVEEEDELPLSANQVAIQLSMEF